MSHWIDVDQKNSLLSRLAAWWHTRRSSAIAAPCPACCVADDREGAAHDADVNSKESQVQAGQWPRAANLLDRTMERLKRSSSGMSS
jgi:hypothetical protein